MNYFDALCGGSVRRLAKYRAGHARRLETIRACRSPEAAERFIDAGGYSSALNHRGAWMGDAHGLSGTLDAMRERGERVDSVSAPWGLVDAWRDVGDAADIVPMRHTGWYADADQDGLYVGHVWQLPARGGASQYVAGYVEQSGGLPRGMDPRRATGYVVLEHDGRGLVTYDDEEDAARAADALAESAAEEAREYSERWREASDADADRDAARDALRDARAAAGNVIHAWRAQMKAGPAAPEICELLRGKLADARDDMRRALRDIRKAADRIAGLDMAGEFH